MELVIRDAVIDDLESLRSIFEEVDNLHHINLPWMYNEGTREFRDRNYIQDLIENDDSNLLVAEIDSIVGIAIVMVKDTPDIPLFVTDRIGTIDTIAVSSNYRRKGIGTALVRAAEAWAVEKGAKRFELSVFDFNEPARRLYDSLGYETLSLKMIKRNK